MSFTKDMKEFFSQSRVRADSLVVEEGTLNPKAGSIYVKNRKTIKDESLRKKWANREI